MTSDIRADSCSVMTGETEEWETGTTSSGVPGMSESNSIAPITVQVAVEETRSNGGMWQTSFSTILIDTDRVLV